MKQHAIIALSVLCVVMGSAQAQNASKPQIDYTPLEVVAEITIAPDGSVESFALENGSIPTLRSLLAKRSSDLRFVPPVWRGKPVRLSTSVWALVNLAKRPDGTLGAILRDVSHHVTKPSQPKLPRSLRGKVSTMVYSVEFRADGKLTAHELMWPAPATRFEVLDATTRRSVNAWRAAPLRVDGQPITCNAMYPVQFVNASGPLILPDVQLNLDTPEACPRIALDPRFVSTVL